MNPSRAPLFAALALLAAAPPCPGASVDLLLQVIDSGAHSAVNLRDDGVPVADGHPFGVDTVNALTVEVSSMSGAPAVQSVRFEYDKGDSGWTLIGTDAVADDPFFGVTWDLGGLTPGGDYGVRAVVRDVLGNEYPGQVFTGCSVNE